MNNVIEWGDQTKAAIASTSAGKPIIDQLDIAIDTASDLANLTRKIIAKEQKKIRSKIVK